MRIVVGGIHTECSTYSPLQQTGNDFQLVEGNDLLEQVGLRAGLYPDMQFRPLFHARSVPGGPVAHQCYLDFKSRFLARLKAEMPIDGVLLIMHGAMHVPGMEDPEGDWIASVRALAGDEVPIAVSYDLHGNVTQKIIDQIDIFCAYRTAPHIDVGETHGRAVCLLVEQLRGGPRQCVAWVPIPVLLPGERTSTEDDPARSLYAALPEFDKRDGISDANLMVGYVWADTPRATAAAVVTAQDPVAGKTAAEEIAAAYWSKRNEFDFGVPTKSLNACLDDAAVAGTFPFILADSGDNPTGGGVGDRNDVLVAWLSSGMTGAVFAGIADPTAIGKLWDKPENTQVEVSIGGSLGSPCPPLTTTVTVVNKAGSHDSKDREVLVEISGNHLVLTERRRPFHNAADFSRFGFEPASCKFLVVKSGYLSPELAPLANPARMALTEGAVNQDITKLTNICRPEPCFPFQENFEWSPVGRLSQRDNPKN